MGFKREDIRDWSALSLKRINDNFRNLWLHSFGSIDFGDFNSKVQAWVKHTDTEITNRVTKIEYQQDMQTLQNQIDGVQYSWFYAYVPTLSNEPALSWTTDGLRDDHIGDTFTDTSIDGNGNSIGYSYRFIKDGTIYKWAKIIDTEATQALHAASKAQDTADAKRRVFVSTPYVPYDVGDLWVQGSTGDMYKCKTAKAVGGSYSFADWGYASKYTDDSYAKAVEQNLTRDIEGAQSIASAASQAAADAQSAAADAASDAEAANRVLEDLASDSKLTPSEKLAVKKEWEVIVSEEPDIEDQGTIYGLESEKSGYIFRYNELKNYLVPLLADITATSDIDGNYFRSVFSNYYQTKGILLKAVADLAKSLADNAQSAANTAYSNADEARAIADAANTNATTARDAADGAMTDASSALSQIDDMASDAKLTPVEKISINKEWNEIISEKPKIDASATDYEINAGTEANYYTMAYNDLNTYIEPLLTDITVTSDIESSLFKMYFKNYYDKRQDLLNAIAKKAKDLADAANSGVSGLEGRMFTAEQKITDSAIISTVRSSSEYKSDLGVNKWVWSKFDVNISGIPSYASIKGISPSRSVAVADATYVTSTTAIGTDTEYYVGLMSTYVYMSADCTITTYPCHDDGGQIYVNGTSVYSNASWKQIGSAQPSVATNIAFKKGWNRIEIMWAEGSGGDFGGLGITISTNPNVSMMACYINPLTMSPQLVSQIVQTAENVKIGFNGITDRVTIDNSGIAVKEGGFSLVANDGSLLGWFGSSGGGFSKLTVNQLIADNIYGMQTQGATYYVNSTGSDTNNGSSGTPFKTISKALSMLNKIFVGNITVTIYVSGTISDNVLIENFQGNGAIKIAINPSAVLNGNIVARGCNVSIEISGGRDGWNSSVLGGLIQPPSWDTGIDIFQCKFVWVNGVRIKTSSGCGVYFNGTNGAITYSDISGASDTFAIFADKGSMVGVYDNRGSNNAYWGRADMSIIYSTDYNGGNNTGIPNSVNGFYYGIAGKLDLDGLPMSASNSQDPSSRPSSQTYTSQWTATQIDSWRPSGWRSDNNYVYQGEYNGYGQHRGFMIFDSASIRSALSGATINSVKIYMVRQNAGGSSAAQNLHWWGHNYDSTGGGYDLNTDFGYHGSLSWGQGAWIDLGATVGNYFRDNNIHGLALYDGSNNYLTCTNMPILEITYTK